MKKEKQDKEKKKKKEMISFPIPIFNHSLQCYFGDGESLTEALLNDGLSKETVTSILRSMDFEKAKGIFLYNKDEDYYLLWMPERPRTVEHYSTLVHELQHFVFLFLDKRGFTHSDDSDEMYSYLLGFIYGSIDAYIQGEREKEENNNE